MFSKPELYRANKAIRKLAKANEVSEETIRSEMKLAINAGFYSPDSAAHKTWKASPFDGRTYATDRIFRKRESRGNRI